MSGAPIIVRHCGECPLGTFICDHPDVPKLALDCEPLRMARLTEMTLSKIDGARPPWCPLNKRSLIIRRDLESDRATSEVRRDP